MISMPKTELYKLPNIAKNGKVLPRLLLFVCYVTITVVT